MVSMGTQTEANYLIMLRLCIAISTGNSLYKHMAPTRSTNQKKSLLSFDSDTMENLQIGNERGFERSGQDSTLYGR